MSDTVKIELSQIDEETGDKISYVLVEWYGSPRDLANIMTMGIVSAVSGEADKWRSEKATGNPTFVEDSITQGSGLIRSR